MGKNLLGAIQQLLAFAFVGLLFFMWMLGYMENSDLDVKGTPTARAGLGLASDSETATPETVWRGRDERNASFEMPRQVTGRRSSSYASAGENTETSGSRRLEERSAISRAEVVRTWKGVHRDMSYAADCYNRFGREVKTLSREYGLYPEVFLARIIAYSYEFVENAGQDPRDFNFPALKKGDSSSRAQFGSTRESLRAYAALNAGETNALSMEAALAKHDRAWTMRKIIDSNRFMAELNGDSEKGAAYKGNAGPASRFSESESRELEYSGEALKMVSSVEQRIKQRQAKEAGYDDWDEYMGSLPEEMKEKQQDHTKAVISTVSKKKAFNLQRRVDAKSRN